MFIIGNDMSLGGCSMGVRSHSNNLTLLTDLYQINMAYAHYQSGKMEQQVVFDLFFRQNPNGNGYTVAAGLEQIIHYIEEFGFTDEDIDYLRTIYAYDEPFLDFLHQLRFTGDLRAVPEGTIVFPQEPLIRIKAKMIEAQLLETTILNIMNHQSLIATKAVRIVESAGNKPVMEFGLRRAQGPDAGLYGARAAYIGGVDATSNVLAGKSFGIPVQGTHAHSYVQSFPTEVEAFRAFSTTFPNQAILLVDTYNTLESGIPNAIRVFREMKEKLGDGFTRFGIRLDSGDLAYLSKEARKQLDDAGFPEAIIVASSDLDERLLQDLNIQGAAIDVWGVGTNLITSSDCPALGGVYKLVAHEEEEGKLVPKIKVSENPAKITNPGMKKVARFYNQDTGRAILDLILLEEEEIPTSEFIAFDPIYPWKKKTVKRFTSKELLVPIYLKGKKVYNLPTLMEIREHLIKERGTFSQEIRRITNPHGYHVDLSKPLWELKQRLVEQGKRG
jgi:nicotinate phosphoribosyltransferase